MGRWQWHVVGCYIDPRNASDIENVAAAIMDQPYGAEILVANKLNANLADPEGTAWVEAIADKLTAAGIKDTGLHFLPRCKPWLQDRCTWSMRRDGREVRSQTDYILGTDHRLFQDVAVQDPRHSSDNCMVLGCMRGEPEKELMDYIRKSRRFPLCPIHCDLASTSENIFSDLKNKTPKPPLREQVRRDWISDKTWEDMDARVTALWEGDQRTVWQLSRWICTGLRTDRMRLAEESGCTIESLLALEPPSSKRGLGPDAGVL